MSDINKLIELLQSILLEEGPLQPDTVLANLGSWDSITVLRVFMLIGKTSLSS